MSPVERALDYIKRSRSSRTPELATLLRMAPADVDALLEPERAKGVLIACQVELAGGAKVIEYRLSTSGGHTHAYGRSHFTYGTAAQALARAAQPETGETHMPLVGRIKAAFEKHGPMTTRELRAHVDHDNVAVYCSQLADRGVLGRLGGGHGSTIYGLPTQSLKDRKEPAAATDKPPRRLHAKKKSRAGGPLQCGVSGS